MSIKDIKLIFDLIGSIANHFKPLKINLENLTKTKFPSFGLVLIDLPIEVEIENKGGEAIKLCYSFSLENCFGEEICRFVKKETKWFGE